MERFRRFVKSGERARTLCIPITRKRREEDSERNRLLPAFFIRRVGSPDHAALAQRWERFKGVEHKAFNVEKRKALTLVPLHQKCISRKQIGERPIGWLEFGHTSPSPILSAHPS